MDSRFKKVVIQLSSGGVVTAASPDHFRVGAHKEVEAGIGGMTAPPVKICVLNDHETPGPDRGPHPAKKVHRLAQMLEEKPRIHHVVGVRLVPAADVPPRRT